MKALVKTHPGPGLDMEEVELPRIQSDEVLVKVKVVSICGTDVHIYKWNGWAEERVRHIPQVVGHEFAGEIVQTGEDVRTLRVGDYISADSHIPCTRCVQCRTGHPHICQNLKILGVDCDGCFAEYVAIPERSVWRNDPALPLDVASVQDPLGNAVYCTLVEPVAGQSLLIFGDGPIGLFAVGVARASGAREVILVGHSEYPMRIASKMGADLVINGLTEDVVKRVMEETHGIGVDVVLEMSGSQEAIDQGLQLIRKGGRFSAFGISPGAVHIDLNNGVVFKGIRIYGINGRLMFETWVQMADMLRSHRLDISPVITHRMPFAECEKGFSLMMERPKCAGKVVLFLDPAFLT